MEYAEVNNCWADFIKSKIVTENEFCGTTSNENWCLGKLVIKKIRNIANTTVCIESWITTEKSAGMHKNDDTGRGNMIP